MILYAKQIVCCTLVKAMVMYWYHWCCKPSTKQHVSYVVNLSPLPQCPICCVFHPSTQDSTSDWSWQLSSHTSNNAGSVTGFSQAKAAAKKDGVKTILFFGILIGLKAYSTSARPFATHCSYEGFCGGSLENSSSGKGTNHDCYSTTWEP